MKKILVFILLLLNSVVLALDFNFPLNATIKTSCNYNAIDDDPYNNKKMYEFILKSNDNIFENYHLFEEKNDLITFATKYYTVNPIKVSANNKSEVHAFLSEEDFKNIFKSLIVQVNFDPSLIALNTRDYYEYSLSNVKPKSTLILRRNELQGYIDKCNRDYNKYLLEHNQHKKQKEDNKMLIIISASIAGLIVFAIIVILVIKFLKVARKKVETKVKEVKKEKRKEEVKSLIENETIKGTIKKSFEFSEKNNINELQEAISDALSRNDVLEAQKLIEILKKATDK